MSKEELISVDYEIHGRVQGVFFRKYTQVSICFLRTHLFISVFIYLFHLMLFRLMCLFTRWPDQIFIINIFNHHFLLT